MRLWRGLKSSGAGLLRDGVYVLPSRAEHRSTLEEQALEIRSAGGAAHILSFEADSEEQNAAILALFDRTAEYEKVIGDLEALKRAILKLRENEARNRLAAITREVTAIAAREFFPGESRSQIEGALADAEAAVNARFAPDEPHSAQLKLRRRDLEEYRGRTWATRERIWVDRVASAWLIRRFIDRQAKFLWLKRVGDCPKRAVGFDFDGAEFTHVGAKVTFEVLVSSFGLEDDAALSRLAAMVHHLDVGGIPTPEGPGFVTIMSGARASQPDDDALLKVITPVLDSLYAGYESMNRANDT